MLRGPRMPPGPAFGLGPPGFMGPGISPVHNMHPPRLPMPPVGRGLPAPPGDSVSIQPCGKLRK